jgi:hypothetical protein
MITLKSTICCISLAEVGRGKLNNGTDPKDMPSLPTMDVSGIMLVDIEDYQPGCPWKAFDNNDNDEPRQNLNRVSYGNNDWDDRKIEGV